MPCLGRRIERAAPAGPVSAKPAFHQDPEAQNGDNGLPPLFAARQAILYRDMERIALKSLLTRAPLFGPTPDPGCSIPVQRREPRIADDARG